MQFIKSLFCWQGLDNRRRFVLITLSCFLAFIIFNESLKSFTSSAIIFLLFLSVITLASTRRRLNDAKLEKKWTLVPTAGFVLVAIIAIFLKHAISYGLFILPLLMVMLLMTYPSRSKSHFILGYAGPVDLSEFQVAKKDKVRSRQRIEPTLHGATSQQAAQVITEQAQTTVQPERQANQARQKDIAETIRLTLLTPKNFRILLVSFSLVFITILALALYFKPTTDANELPNALATEDIAPQPDITPYQHRLTLPDNFTLMFDGNNALVIHWQANVTDKPELWSLASAQGDRSCEHIAFNNAKKIRSMRVSVKESGYYAYFSPLDTKALVKNIAFKNKFSLCGFDFSLKGSQATLGKSNFYANLIDY
ncbi:hypothetical protein SAMN05216262_10360 [Colwellia chukchiensis]|uniref:DUF805 domain-containing protein n=1 Tax=Colwellia chukchiensis TaxID=641665 RepID=A0A1H7K9L9_9GAMM|nr:hypothetical protein [Colwellia chukchiensis]SEK83156.1 hypothetical protein SAMN05216262_10360 [Colwellia chukchiensis]